MNTLKNKLNQFPIWLILIIFTIVIISLNLLLNIVFDYTGSSILKENPIIEKPQYILFFSTVFLAPIIETLIYQLLIIELLSSIEIKIFFKWNIKKYKYYYTIYSSAIAFSLSHNFGISYLIFTFLSGLIFAIMYLYLKKREGISIAFLVCLMVHVFNNVFVFFTTM